MKPIYPFPEMQVGDVREIYSQRKIQAVRSAAHMHAKKCERKGYGRPVFKVSLRDDPASMIGETAYRIERTA